MGKLVNNSFGECPWGLPYKLAADKIQRAAIIAALGKPECLTMATNLVSLLNRLASDGSLSPRSETIICQSGVRV